MQKGNIQIILKEILNLLEQRKKNSKYLSIDIIRVNIYFKKYIDLLPAGGIFGSLKKQNSGEKMGAK